LIFFVFTPPRGALARYPKRSNTESTSSMIKRNFTNSVRSKTNLAMRNKVLAKPVRHNLCRLISAMYEMGVNPVFRVD
jgi:transposase